MRKLGRSKSVAGLVAVGLLTAATSVGCGLPELLQQVQITAQAITLGANIVASLGGVRDAINSGTMTAEQGAAHATVQVIDLLSNSSPAVLEAAVNQAASLAGSGVTINTDQATAIKRVVDSLDTLSEDQILALVQQGGSPVDPAVNSGDLTNTIQELYGIAVTPDDLEQLRNVLTLEGIGAPAR